MFFSARSLLVFLIVRMDREWRNHKRSQPLEMPPYLGTKLAVRVRNDGDFIFKRLPLRSYNDIYSASTLINIPGWAWSRASESYYTTTYSSPHIIILLCTGTSGETRVRTAELGSNWNRSNRSQINSFLLVTRKFNVVLFWRYPRNGFVFHPGALLWRAWHRRVPWCIILYPAI